MKRYSFSTFEVNDANRQAHDVCRAVADLEPISPLPILLLGDEACGKTHLLYSIVNRVRGGSAKTGLAYVTAMDFPEQVRALIDDPSPLQRAHSAILLVDQLEQFAGHVDELEAVVRIFLNHHHYVVLASNVHPARLSNLTDGLIDLINKGQTARITSKAAKAAASTPEQDKLVAQQRDEIRQLKEKLAEERARAVPPEELASLRQQVEKATAENRSLRNDLAELQDQARVLHEKTESQKLEALDAETGELAALKETTAIVEEENAELRERIRLLEADRDDARDRIAEFEAAAEGRADLNREIEKLRSRVVEIQADAEAAGSRAMQLDAVLAAKSAIESQMHKLRKDLETAQNEGAAARHEANELVHRAETLLQQIDANRARFAETDRQQREHIQALEARIRELESTSVSADDLEEAQIDLERTRAEAESLRTDAEEVRQDLGELRAVFAQTQQSFELELSMAKTTAARAEEDRDAAIRRQQELQAARDEAVAEQERLAAISDDVGSRHEGLSRMLDEARAELVKTQEEAQATLSETQEQAQARLTETQEQAQAKLVEIQDQARAREAELRDLLTRAEQECARRLAAHEDAEARNVNLELEMGKLREELDAQGPKLEALQAESSARLADALARVDEADAQVRRLQAALEIGRQTGSILAADLDAVREQMADATEAVAKLSSRLLETTTIEIPPFVARPSVIHLPAAAPAPDESPAEPMPVSEVGIQPQAEDPESSDDDQDLPDLDIIFPEPEE